MIQIMSWQNTHVCQWQPDAVAACSFTFARRQSGQTLKLPKQTISFPGYSSTRASRRHSHPAQRDPFITEADA